MNREHAKRILDFQGLRRDVPLTAILEHYGFLGDLKKMGAQLYGACPLHGGSNKRQFVVNPATSEWKCFSPHHNAGGGALEFVVEKENLPTITHAAELVASWFAIPSGSVISKPAERRSRKMSGEKPSHKAFVVEPREEGSEEKAFWTRVGSAWPHGDGKGLNIQLATGVSVSGRVVLREYTEKDAEEDEKKVTKFKKK